MGNLAAFHERRGHDQSNIYYVFVPDLELLFSFPYHDHPAMEHRRLEQIMVPTLHIMGVLSLTDPPGCNISASSLLASFS